MSMKATLPVLTAGLILLAGCKDNPSPAEPEVGASTAAGNLSVGLAQSGQIRTMDDDLADLVGQIPGFGGYFIDRDARLNVYLVDPRQPAIAQAVLTQRLSNRPASLRGRVLDLTPIKFLQAQYDFRQLHEWRERARGPLFSIVGVTSLDISDDRNRVAIGIESMALLRRVEEELVRLKIPRDAAIIEERAYTRLAATLRDRMRPTEGGIEVKMPQRGPNSACTLGFNAYQEGNTDSGPVFLTNSHCTLKQGGVESTEFHQGGSRIGVEIADPPYFDSIANPRCSPSKFRCRYSDAALVRYDSRDLQRFGYIAKTLEASRVSSTLTIDPNNQRFRIYDIYPHNDILKGTMLDKIGRTTGWTYGYVTNACVDLATDGFTGDGHPVALLCQYRVSGGSDEGDSGSPVFAWISDIDPVRLYGVMWGGDKDKTHYNFSSMYYIQQELGRLITYGTEPTKSGDPDPGCGTQIIC